MRNHITIIVGAALVLSGGLIAAIDEIRQPTPSVPAQPTPAPKPCPGPGPCPIPPPCPGPGPCPRRPSVNAVVVGGPRAADGTEVECDLPVSLRTPNTGGRDGAGLCVFTSIMHAARYQGERRLWDFQRDMTHEPGGGYPDKVDRMIAKYGPGTKYVQYEGADPGVIRQAIAAGRMASVTWDGYHDPHYNGHHIAHMVNCVQYTDRAVCLLDNNFVGDGELLWMTPGDFQQGWTGGGDGGWAVVLLNPAPPPVPKMPAPK